MLDPNDLLLFARVAEAGSFSRAAERLRLPKSTVSRRIAALERQLGERLMQRTTRKLTLTEFGLAVLDHGRQVAAEVDGALALALHRQARPSGKLRVSMPGDFASVSLADMLAGFVRDHPAIELELDLTPRRVDLVGEGYDLAIRMADRLPDDTQLSARRLAVFTTGLYAAPDYLAVHGEPLAPEALADLHGLLVLGRSGEPLPWTLEHDGVLWSGMPAQRTVANSPDLLIRLARAGAGVAAVAHHFAEPHVRRGELRRLLPQWQHQPAVAWAVFPGRRLMPAKTRVFLEALGQVLSVSPEVEQACIAAERRAREREAAALNQFGTQGR